MKAKQRYLYTFNGCSKYIGLVNITNDGWVFNDEIEKTPVEDYGNFLLLSVYLNIEDAFNKFISFLEL